MDQQSLYSTIENAHFEVLMFEDHPGFFGNWRAILSRRKRTFEIVSDHREGWIQLWEIRQGQLNLELKSESNPPSSQAEELALLDSWLAELARA
jgi:hypothetical protein